MKILLCLKIFKKFRRFCRRRRRRRRRRQYFNRRLLIIMDILAAIFLMSDFSLNVINILFMLSLFILYYWFLFNNYYQFPMKTMVSDCEKLSTYILIQD